MTNIEKVMSWLEGLSEPDWRDFHSDSEVQNIAKSALKLLQEQEHKDKMFHALEDDWKRLKELLKEQEPVEKEIEGGGASWWYVCEECHGSVDYYDSFCRHCGRPFKKKKSACDGCEYKGSDDCIQGQPGSENAYCPNGKLG